MAEQSWSTTRVIVFESERGWGQKIVERREFKTREEAEQFCREYNADNVEPEAPDWYMAAKVVD